SLAVFDSWLLVTQWSQESQESGDFSNACDAFGLYNRTSLRNAWLSGEELMHFHRGGKIGVLVKSSAGHTTLQDALTLHTPPGGWEEQVFEKRRDSELRSRRKTVSVGSARWKGAWLVQRRREVLDHYMGLTGRNVPPSPVSLARDCGQAMANS